MLPLQIRSCFILSLTNILCAFASCAAVVAAPPDLIKPLNNDNFDENVVGRKGLVLVVFSMRNCPFCVKAQPHLEKLASIMRMSVTVGQIDADESQELVRKCSVSGVPTVILFENGQEVYRLGGYDHEEREKLSNTLYKHIYSPSPRAPSHAF